MIEDAAQLRLLYSQRDFQISLSALTFLSEVEPENSYSIEELRRFRCYLDTATISYWRPFSKSPNLPVLNASDLGFTTTEQSLHKCIHAYRDKVVAHSDVDRMRIGFHTIHVSEGLSLPQIRFDEGLELVDQVDPWIALVRKIIGICAYRLWDIAQSAGGETSYIKDFTNPDIL